MKVTANPWRVRNAAVLLSGALTMGLAGCGGSEDDGPATSNEPAVKTNTAAEIAQESAADYANNVNGLITGSTLKGWIDNWSANRPAGITGKLVILQASDGEAGFELFKPDGTDVFSYSIPSNEWIETRSNGVIETVSMVPSGRAMDTFLAKYDIDPNNDMIVCAQGTAGAGQSMRAGRCWYMFRYWGTPKENLAVLNGGNQWNGSNAMDASYFSTTGSTPPGTGTVSVKDLPENNVALMATLQDMFSVVPTQDMNLLGDGVFIWDARGTNEYSPASDSDFRGGAIQGHPNGALELNYSNLLDSAQGYTFKSKSEIQAYLNGEADAAGNSFVDSTLQGVGYGRAYQDGDVVYTYCQTTFRAMITGFASAAIMGLPTRFYDGAMYQWNNLNTVVNGSGTAPLPADSPWRTDQADVSAFTLHSDPASLSAPSITNAYAASANAIVNEDLAYKGLGSANDGGSDTGGDSGSGGSGGGAPALPANPCGG